MHGSKNVVSKFVDWSDEAKKPGEKGADGESGYAIPYKKHNYTTFGDRAFFPSDLGMKNVS